MQQLRNSPFLGDTSDFLNPITNFLIACHEPLSSLFLFKALQFASLEPVKCCLMMCCTINKHIGHAKIHPSLLLAFPPGILPDNQGYMICSNCSESKIYIYIFNVSSAGNITSLSHLHKSHFFLFLFLLLFSHSISWSEPCKQRGSIFLNIDRFSKKKQLQLEPFLMAGNQDIG